MTFTRDEVGAGLLNELALFEDLIRPLDAAALATPSRCAGWTVGDVIAHVVGGQADVTAGRFDGIGTPEYTQRQVDERKDRNANELADELAGVRKTAADLLVVFDDAAWASAAPGGLPITLGEGVESLWYDTYLHADDIRHALDLPSVTTGDGVRVSVDHVALFLKVNEWAPATLALDGYEEIVIGDPALAGQRRITGDPHTFVLVGTGRADPALLGLDETVNIYAG